MTAPKKPYTFERYVRTLTRRLGKHFYYKQPMSQWGFIYCDCPITEFGAVARVEGSTVTLIDYRKYLNPNKTHKESWINCKPEKRNTNGPIFDAATPNFEKKFKSIPKFHNKILKYLNEPQV